MFKKLRKAFSTRELKNYLRLTLNSSEKVFLIMTLYFQRKEPGLQIVYLASSDRIARENIHIQIVGALRLHGISPLDAAELDRDIVNTSTRKLGNKEPDLNSITRYATYTRYASVNLSPRHTQCILELPKNKKNLQDLVVCIHSWLDMPQDKLQTYLQRGIVDTLYQNGIREIDSKRTDIPERHLDQSKPFTSFSSLRSHA